MTVAATLILTIILWVLYHKIFNVIYFNAPKGCMVEIGVCFILAAIISTIIFGNPKKDNERSLQEESSSVSYSSVSDNRPNSTSKSFPADPDNNNIDEYIEMDSSETANDDKMIVNNNGREYSDGVVWVEKHDEIWYLCDKSANILFALGFNSYPTTDYVDGVAIIDDSILIDKAGNVISSVNDGEYEKMVFFNDGYGDALFLGYTFVSDYINTFDYSGYRYGIIDSKGKWHLELTPNIEFRGYIGDGLFSYTELGTDEIKGGEYNLYTNQFTLADNLDGYFSNDYAEKGDGSLYNSHGDRIDLSEYPVIANPNDLYFENGYCILEVINNSGGAFMTVIDEDGNRLFEPIPCEGHGKLSNGLIALLKDGERQFINVNGETIINLPYATRIYDFTKDGIAKIEYESIVQYIDTQGNEIFKNE